MYQISNIRITEVFISEEWNSKGFEWFLDVIIIIIIIVIYSSHSCDANDSCHAVNMQQKHVCGRNFSSPLHDLSTNQLPVNHISCSWFLWKVLSCLFIFILPLFKCFNWRQKKKGKKQIRKYDFSQRHWLIRQIQTNKVLPMITSLMFIINYSLRIAFNHQARTSNNYLTVYQFSSLF